VAIVASRSLAGWVVMRFGRSGLLALIILLAASISSVGSVNRETDQYTIVPGIARSFDVAAPGQAPVSSPPTPTYGPLVVSQDGPYFVDQLGRPVLLVGSHTWDNLVDWDSVPNPEARFDFSAYLEFLKSHHLNVARLWTWEQATGVPGAAYPVHFAPGPFARTGPGTASDGQPAFNLDVFDEQYFERLRSRVEEARNAGIYVAIMLFNGFSVDDKGRDLGNPCQFHPFYGGNNVNDVDIDLNRDGNCEEAHTLANETVTRYQEAYVRRVIETVGDFDNVLYEISNESHAGSVAWQYHMIDFVRSVGAARGQVHPVGMTIPYPGGANQTLWQSTADWISPNDAEGYTSNPMPYRGERVVILDTDHLWGIGGDADWVWKAVTRGYNVMYMDCYEYRIPECTGSPNDVGRLGVLGAMGIARQTTLWFDLLDADPNPDVCSTGWCLVDDVGPRIGGLIYNPEVRTVTVRMGTSPSDASSSTLSVQWYTSEGCFVASSTATLEPQVTLTPPHSRATVVVFSSDLAGTLAMHEAPFCGETS
jgi:hypothetical protein